MSRVLRSNRQINNIEQNKVLPDKQIKTSNQELKLKAISLRRIDTINKHENNHKKDAKKRKLPSNTISEHERMPLLSNEIELKSKKTKIVHNKTQETNVQTNSSNEVKIRQLRSRTISTNDRMPLLANELELKSKKTNIVQNKTQKANEQINSSNEVKIRQLRSRTISTNDRMPLLSNEIELKSKKTNSVHKKTPETNVQINSSNEVKIRQLRSRTVSTNERMPLLNSTNQIDLKSKKSNKSKNQEKPKNTDGCNNKTSKIDSIENFKPLSTQSKYPFVKLKRHVRLLDGKQSEVNPMHVQTVNITGKPSVFASDMDVKNTGTTKISEDKSNRHRPKRKRTLSECKDIMPVVKIAKIQDKFIEHNSKAGKNFIYRTNHTVQTQNDKNVSKVKNLNKHTKEIVVTEKKDDDMYEFNLSQSSDSNQDEEMKSVINNLKKTGKITIVKKIKRKPIKKQKNDNNKSWNAHSVLKAKNLIRPKIKKTEAVLVTDNKIKVAPTRTVLTNLNFSQLKANASNFTPKRGTLNLSLTKKKNSKQISSNSIKNQSILTSKNQNAIHKTSDQISTILITNDDNEEIPHFDDDARDDDYENNESLPLMSNCLSPLQNKSILNNSNAENVDPIRETVKNPSSNVFVFSGNIVRGHRSPLKPIPHINSNNRTVENVLQTPLRTKILTAQFQKQIISAETNNEIDKDVAKNSFKTNNCNANDYFGFLSDALDENCNTNASTPTQKRKESLETKLLQLGQENKFKKPSTASTDKVQKHPIKSFLSKNKQKPIINNKSESRPKNTREHFLGPIAHSTPEPSKQPSKRECRPKNAREHFLEPIAHSTPGPSKQPSKPKLMGLERFNKIDTSCFDLDINEPITHKPIKKYTKKKYENKSPKKMSQKETNELHSFYDEFNSICEEVEQYQLVIE